MRNRNIVRLTAILAAAAWGGPTMAAAAMAQSSVPAARSVRIALPDSFPSPGARALVARFTNGRDVILLDPATASAEALQAAVTVLAELRSTAPRVANTQVITVQGFAVPPSASSRSMARFRDALERLRRQPVTRIGNLGRGRWIELEQASRRRLGA